MQVSADDTQTSGEVRRTAAQFDLLRNQIKVEPIAVGCRNNALGAQNRAVQLAIAQLFETLAQIRLGVAVCGLFAPCREHIVRMVVAVLMMMTAGADTVFIIVMFMMMLMLVIMAALVVMMVLMVVIMAAFMVVIVMMLVLVLIVVMTAGADTVFVVVMVMLFLLM